LAYEYLKAGYTNVKVVAGGGKAMEQFFDHYRGRYLISPSRNKRVKIQ